MTDRVLIIAEAGVNHNGSIHLAKKLIDKAVFSGADIVKFQTFKAKNMVSKNKKKDKKKNCVFKSNKWKPIFYLFRKKS